MSLWIPNELTGEIKFPRGDTPEIKLRMTIPAAAQNVTVTFTMRKEANANSPVVLTKQFTETAAGSGIYTMRFGEADTKQLEYGRYAYDIEYRDITTPGDPNVETLVVSYVTLTSEVTIHE